MVTIRQIQGGQFAARGEYRDYRGERCVYDGILPREIMTEEAAMAVGEKRRADLEGNDPSGGGYMSHSMRQMVRELDRDARFTEQSYERGRATGYTADEIDGADSEGRIDDFGNVVEA